MIPPQPETLAALLTAGRAHDPALILPEAESTLDFARLEEAVGELAGILCAAGVERGDRVALVLPDGPTLLQALLAVAAVGAAAAPLNPAYTKDEYAFYLDDLDPRLLVLPPDELSAARAATPERILVGELLVEAGRPTLRVGGKDVPTAVTFEPANPDDTALLLHTSGTTSRPKQVPLLHRNLMASARAIVAHYRLEASDVSYCAMPLFHVHGLVASAFAALLAGGVVVLPQRFSPRRLLEHLHPHAVTWFSAGPTIHQAILERAGNIDGGYTTSLRFIRSCSSALSPALMERVERRFSVPVLEAYGMTEASHQISSNPLPPGRRLPGSVGVPTGTEVRVVDAEGRDAPLRSTGEVVIRGRGVTPGYLNNPDANAEAFLDGWFRTGDRGVLNGEGYLRLEGRLKEMIIRGGENISPYEVEEILLGHPAVVDAVCFGVPDEKYGEEVAAAVALTSGATSRELHNFCRERLAAFKTPTVIHIVDKIPRTATGKLQRRRVAALLPKGSS